MRNLLLTLMILVIAILAGCNSTSTTQVEETDDALPTPQVQGPSTTPSATPIGNPPQ